MGATIEHVVGWLIRVGPAHERYGDPYTLVVMAERVSQTDEWVLKGMGGDLTGDAWREMEDLLAARGVKRFRYTRLVRGKARGFVGEWSEAKQSFLMRRDRTP